MPPNQRQDYSASQLANSQKQGRLVRTEIRKKGSERFLVLYFHQQYDVRTVGSLKCPTNYFTLSQPFWDALGSLYGSRHDPQWARELRRELKEAVDAAQNRSGRPGGGGEPEPEGGAPKPDGGGGRGDTSRLRLCWYYNYAGSWVANVVHRLGFRYTTSLHSSPGYTFAEWAQGFLDAPIPSPAGVGDSVGDEVAESVLEGVVDSVLEGTADVVGSSAASSPYQAATSGSVSRRVSEGGSASVVTGHADPALDAATAASQAEWGDVQPVPEADQPIDVVGDAILDVIAGLLGIPTNVDSAPGMGDMVKLGYSWQLWKCDWFGPYYDRGGVTVSNNGLRYCEALWNVPLGSKTDCAALGRGELPPGVVPQDGAGGNNNCGGGIPRDVFVLPWGETVPRVVWASLPGA